MKLKLISFLTFSASLTVFGASWSCRGQGHSMIIEEGPEAATLSGETTGNRSFDLGARNLEVHEWDTGEKYLQFSVTGPSAWQTDGRDSDGFVTVRFNKVQNSYVADLRRQDQNSGELELIPFITLTCHLSK